MRNVDSRIARHRVRQPWVLVLLSVVASIVALAALLSLTAAASAAAHGVEGPMAPAAPIPPPQGYPKLSLSTKTVTPTLTIPGGATLTYTIQIRNTGATTATGTIISDPLPLGVTYNGDGWASHGERPVMVDSTLVWIGEVGFDSTVVITFSVRVDENLSGTVRNTATINDAHIARPVTVSAETVVINRPILKIEKSSLPAKPGANKPLVYQLQVTNWGQPAANLPITVTDRVPFSTTLRSSGNGSTSPISDVVTWMRSVNLELGQSDTFTFSVKVNDVPSGTVITNEDYAVAAPFGITTGKPYSVTIVDPILVLNKRVWPDPPGSNREMTYTLTLFNAGSLATGLTITDRVPQGVSYVRGGVANSGIISWSLPELDTGKSERFTYTVYISDVMDVPIFNGSYGVCSTEGICAPGEPLTSVVKGPTFEASAFLDPFVKKPGGGGAPVTPTLIIRNLGPGNAISATALLRYENISVSNADVITISSSTGEPKPHPVDAGIPDCSGGHCLAYIWVGNVQVGEVITFTTIEGQNSIGGEGAHYTTTVVITDSLVNGTTEPVSGTKIGTVTPNANVIARKSAQPVVGPGHSMTYTIHIWNSGFTTEQPPVLTDVVPLSTTFVHASDGGMTQAISNTVLVSWTLPSLGPGDTAVRAFAVRVDKDLVSGTKIVNRYYSVFGYGNIATGTVTSGPPVTTTVLEVGLIDSFKVVTPQLSLPGPGNVLTFEIHLVNSSGLSLTGVTAHDVLPWAGSTYRRDAFASAGALVSDIISLDWEGDIDAFSSAVFTCSVLVDEGFEGVLTNTVVISHPDLIAPVVRDAVAYVTRQPLLLIQKHATPDPVSLGELLTYRLRVTNLGQQATGLVITDTLPANANFAGASDGGKLYNDTVQWEWPALEPDEKIDFSFQVTVTRGSKVFNSHYGVRSAEGTIAFGAPLVTQVTGGSTLYLPLIVKQAP